MVKDNEKHPEDQADDKIDYDEIDVADIMAQIRQKIASRPEEVSSHEPAEGEPPSSPESPAPPSEHPAGLKSKATRLLLKVTRPFAPVLKLLMFPVYQEFRQTVLILDQTNRRLDTLIRYVHTEINAALERVNIKVDRNVDAVNIKVDRAVNDLNKRVDLTFDGLNPTMEYTRLLHSLAHNIVVEMTKLKIEEEHLKTKTRIMEKDFEFLGKREKALEEHILK